MASQGTLYGIANAMHDAREQVGIASECIVVEKQLEGTLYPENSDAWKNVLHEAYLLRSYLNSVITDLEKETADVV